MANLTGDGGGGDSYAPFADATTNSSPLPSPPVSLLGTIASNMGGLFGGLGRPLQMASQAPDMLGESVDPIQQDLSRLGQNLDMSSFFNQAGRDVQNSPPVQSFEDWYNNINKNFQQGDRQGGIGQGAGQALEYGAFHSPLEGLDVSAGQQLNKGMQWLQDRTRAPEGGYNDVTGPALGTIYQFAALGQGVGNLLEQSPVVDSDIQDSVHRGIKSVFEGQGISWSNQDTQQSLKDVMDAANTVTNNIAGPDQVRNSLNNSFRGQGVSDAQSKQWSDSLAPVVSFLTQMALTAGVGSGPRGAAAIVTKAMTAQFAMQLLSDPMGTVKMLQQQSVGAARDPNQPDYSVLNLLKKIHNGLTGGKGPSPEEWGYGFNSMAQLAATLVGMHGVKHMTTEGIKTGKETVNEFNQGLRGEEVAGTQDNRPTSPTSPTGTAGGEGQGRDVEKAVGTITSAAEQGENPEAANIPETRTQPVSEVASELAAPRRLTDDQRQRLDQVQSNLRTAGYEATSNLNEVGSNLVSRDGYKIGGAWIMPDGTGVNLPAEGYIHDNITDAGYKGLPKAGPYGASSMISAFRENWIRVNNTMGYPDRFGNSRLQSQLEIGNTKNVTTSNLDRYLLANEAYLRNADIHLDVHTAGEGNSYDFTYQDYVNNGLSVKELIKNVDPWKPQVAWDLANSVTGKGPEASQFGVGGNPYWARGALLNPEHIRYAEQALEQTGNNINGIIKKVRVGTEDAVARGRFSVGSPSEVRVFVDGIQDVVGHRDAWRDKIEELQTKGSGSIGSGLSEEQYTRALDVARQNVRELYNVRPEYILADAINHEVIHAQILDMADGGPVITRGAQDAMRIKFLNLLRSTPEGAAWIEDAKQLGFSGQMAVLERLADIIPEGLTNAEADSWLSSRIGEKELAKIHTATGEFEELFNYQLNRHQGTNTHPYILQSGEEAYAHSFWRPDETEENARLAGAWWDAHGPASENPIAGSRSALAAAGAPGGRLGFAAQELASLSARASNRGGGSGDTDQGGLNKALEGMARDTGIPVSEGQSAKSEIEVPKQSPAQVMLGMQRQIAATQKALEAKLEEFQRTAQNPDTAKASADDARAAMERLNNAFDTWRQNIKTLETTTGEAQSVINMTQSLGRLGVAIDLLRDRMYTTEMARLSTVGFKDNLFKLRGIATEANNAKNAWIQAQKDGAPAAKVAQLEKAYQKSYGQFARAYDLHNSKEYRQMNDYKPKRAVVNLTARVAKVLNAKTSRELNAPEFAARAVGLTAHAALDNIRNAYTGIFPGNANHDPRNWDEDFMTIIRGQAGQQVEAAKAEPNDNSAMGVANIPLEKILEDHHTVVDLEKVKSQGLSAFSKQLSDLDVRLEQAKLNRRAKVPGADAEIKQIQKAKTVAQANWENYRRRIDRLIRNHPDMRRSDQHSGQEMTPEAIKEAETVDPKAAVEEAKTDVGDTPVGESLRQEINQINQLLNTPSPDPIGLDNRHRPGNSVPAKIPIEFFAKTYHDAHQAMIAEGGDNADFARTGYSFLKAMADYMDPGRNTFHPAQWFRSFWNSMFGVDHRVNELSTIARRLIKDDQPAGNPPELKQAGKGGVAPTVDTRLVETASKRILKPVEYITRFPEKAKQMLAELSPKEAQLSRYIHELWDTSGKILSDPERALFDQYVTDFIPHVVKELPDGTKIDPRNPRSASRFNESQIARIADKITKQTIFEFLTDLEREGYKVEWDLPTLLDAHLRGTFRAMRNREMLGYFMKTIHEDNGFKGSSVVPVENWQAAQNNPEYSGVEMKNYTSVRFGPYQSTMKRFYVYKPLADEMEKLASIDQMPAFLKNPVKAASWLNKWYKFGRFAINPVHLGNVFSNIATAVSRAGIVDIRLFDKIWGRANRAMISEHRSGSFRLVQNLKNAIPGMKAFSDIESNASGEISTRESNVARLEQQLNDAMEGKASIPVAETRRSKTGRMMKSDSDEALKNIEDIKNRHTSQDTLIKSLEDQLNKEKASLEQARTAYHSIQWVRDRETLARLMGKGLVPDKDIKLATDIGTEGVLDWITKNTPGLREWERWMWHDVVWKGQLGTALELRDQFIKQLASEKYGYKGKSVMEAERLLSPDEIDQRETEAVYWAKNATGMWNAVDNSMFNNLFGRSAFLSMSWTMGQARNARDILPVAVGRKLGRTDLRPFSQQMKDAGFDAAENKALDDLHSRMARRMVFGGMSKLLATAFITSTLGSYIATRQLNTPIQNFMVDPLHTFDIRTGTDPATKKPTWQKFPFYGAQREMADYILTGVKAVMEGKGAGGAVGAVGSRLTGKLNAPAVKLFELTSGIELSKMMNGIGDYQISQDNDIANLERALTIKLGIPDGMPLEDRLLYALRTANPIPAPFANVGLPQAIPIKRDQSGKPILDDQGHEIPLTDPKSLLRDFFGPSGALGYDAISHLGQPIFGADKLPTSNPTGQDVSSMAGYFVGSSYEQTTSVQQEIARQDQQQRQQEKNDLTVELVSAAKNGDFQKVLQIKAQLGLTNGQTVDTIMNGARLNPASPGGTGSPSYVSGIVSTPGDKGAKAATEVGGHILTPTEQDEYDRLVGNRDLYVIQELQKDPQFQHANQVEKSTMLRDYMAIADRISKQEFSQKAGLSQGAMITDQSFQQAMFAYQATRDDAQIVLMENPAYQAGDPSTKQRLEDSMNTIASSMAYDRVFGNYKAMSDQQFTAFVRTSMYSGMQAQNYLQGTEFYQNAPPDEQAKMLTEYTTLARTMTANVYTGKTRNILPIQIPQYMKATINTEESTKYLLHQTDFYQQASLTEQQKLDTKYQGLARSMAQKDWTNGQPMLNTNNLTENYTVGPDRIMLGHMVAQQAFSDFQNNYGGADLITAQEQELAAVKKQIGETTDAPPKTITYLKNIAQQRFYQQNPNYAAYVKARTAFERNTSVGRLYAALNADEVALANQDTGIIEAQTGLGTILDNPMPMDPAQYSDISGVDAAGLSVDSTGISIDPSADLINLGSYVSNSF